MGSTPAAAPRAAGRACVERKPASRVNMNMTSENSGLLALAELRALESTRLGQLEAQRIERAHARQAEAEHAARRAAELAEQAALAQAAGFQRAREHRALQELDEQRRVAEAAAQARIEQQARLRQEAQRLELQMRAAERAAAPRWPYAVVPALVAMLALAGGIAWHDTSTAARLEHANAEQRTAYDQQMAEVAKKLDVLAARQQRLEGERVELERKLSEAASDAERTELRARVAEIDRELAPGAAPVAASVKAKPARPKQPRPHAAVDSQPREQPTETGKEPGRKPIVLGDGSDPLDGLR